LLVTVGFLSAHAHNIDLPPALAASTSIDSVATTGTIGGSTSAPLGGTPKKRGASTRGGSTRGGSRKRGGSLKCVCYPSPHLPY
jgi:hypothetical protein